MKRKVCMIIPSFTAKGGITSVISGYKGSQLEKDYDIKYIETYCDGNKVKKIVKALRAYVTFVGYCLKNKPALVHIHSSFGGSFYRKSIFVQIASLMRIPTVNHIHGSELDKLYSNASLLKKMYVESVIKKCSLIIVLSEECKTKISRINVSFECRVIKNYGNYHIEALGIKKVNQVLFLGFLTELKGCFDIPYIIKNVVSRFPDTKFVLGGIGEQNKIEKRLKELGISANVDFPGWVQNDAKDKLFRESKLFLLPSYTEAMPMSILEAMGYGLPIVSTNVGGIPQLVKHGYNGYLYAPGSIDEMSSSIICLLQDEDKVLNFGKNSFDIIKNDYSLGKHIENIIRVYEEIINENEKYQKKPII